MSFAETLQDLRECRGVVTTAIADRDGIAVESWGPNRREAEEIVAEYSTFLHEMVTANRELQMGPLEQLIVVGERRSVLITAITEEYFLMVIVERDGNPGKARFASRVAAFRLRREFI